MNEKYFIITIDTEGDDQWDTGNHVSTKNAKFIPRFQELSEKYGFYPTWLTNYEMADDPFYIEYISEKIHNNRCEVGMHLHAWNSPPDYNINAINDQHAYIYEYSYDAMYEKAKILTSKLEDTFNINVTSHRSGRWATNEQYFKVLSDLGYKVDCSFTPFVSWKKLPGATGAEGSDYTDSPLTPFLVYGNIMEVPMTIRPLRYFSLKGLSCAKDLLHEFKYCLRRRKVWVRPTNHVGYSLIKKVINASDEADYIMFMMHSSELMPGGSPFFQTDKDIELLYDEIESLFYYLKTQNYMGCTLTNYYNIRIDDMNNNRYSFGSEH